MELTIVLAILGIVSLLALPKLSAMIRKANEGSTLGKLVSLRSALSIYYADTEGSFPADLSPMTQPGSRYISRFLPVYTADHGNSETVNLRAGKDLSQDTGALGYAAEGGDAGTVWVECSHTDVKGKVWNAY